MVYNIKSTPDIFSPIRNLFLDNNSSIGTIDLVSNF